MSLKRSGGFFSWYNKGTKRPAYKLRRYRNIRGQILRTIPSRFLFELGCKVEESEESHSESLPVESSEPDFFAGSACSAYDLWGREGKIICRYGGR